MLVFLRIRRCPPSQRQWNRPYWVMMALIVAGIVGITFNSQRLERRLDIFRADLKGKWLGVADLHQADARMVNLEDTDLPGAVLQKANLAMAKLQGANLVLADLTGANLEEVKNLTEEQIQSAQINEHTRLPDYLKIPLP
jgi:uncharacterized protein YjbI with pentapeptide repeats